MTQEHVEPHPDAVTTTKAASGRLLDWIPIESQTADGKVATPPPSPARILGSIDSAATAGQGLRFRFELHDSKLERGPKGTVPILRDLRSHRDRVQRRGADKRGRRHPSPQAVTDPDPVGYYHADSGQNGTFFGGVSDMTVYTPILENGAGHSIYQMWLTAGIPLQSAEAGWTVDPGLNGDLTPHLFTYFTTNDYAQDGDNLGGYNRLQKGWVQVSATGFPGMRLASSSIGHDVSRYDMQYMLWQSNWWFKLESEWLGYYPASVYGSGGMGSNATWLAFGGEVYSALPDPTQTNSQMGSGRKGEAGSNGYSAWQRNIQAITSINASGGQFQDFNGTSFAEDGSRYDIVQNMKSGTNWGSVIWAGGSGTGAQP